jgi:transcriptional regulator with XRE-family HTH domain
LILAITAITAHHGGLYIAIPAILGHSPLDFAAKPAFKRSQSRPSAAEPAISTNSRPFIRQRAAIMTLPLPYLLARSREILNLSQLGLAKRLRSSLRTVQRWEASRSTPTAANLHELADAVRPHDPGLAAEMDVWAPRPAAAVVPAPVIAAPPPPAAPALPASILVDLVVCAAAEALGMAPQAARPAVLATFASALKAGLTVDDVVAALAPSRSASEPGAP